MAAITTPTAFHVRLSVAAAIAAFAFGTRAAILDGNVKRVLARCFAIEGAPSAEFIALGKASKRPSVSPQQKADWQRANYALANTLLAADPGEVIRVL